MISPEERLLFIREIYQLKNEHQRCTDNNLKGKIYYEIKLLSEILDSDSGVTLFVDAAYPLKQNK